MSVVQRLQRPNVQRSERMSHVTPLKPMHDGWDHRHVGTDPDAGLEIDPYTAKRIRREEDDDDRTAFNPVHD